MNIKQLNERQFARALSREGKTIVEFPSGKEYQVFFSKSRSNDMQEKIKISYTQDCELQKGSIIRYKDNYYILINKNNVESDVFCSSTGVKCNDIWNINGEIIPVVCGNLSSYNPRVGTEFTDGESTIGNITIYTSSNTKAKDIVPGDINFCCEDHYHIVNRFLIDGLLYLYMQRETLIGEDELQYVDQIYTFDCGKDIQLHIGRIMKNEEGKIIGRYLQNSEYTYTSSNEEVATVTNTGLLSTHDYGVTTITVKTDNLELDINIATVSFPYIQVKNDDIPCIEYFSISSKYFTDFEVLNTATAISKWEIFEDEKLLLTVNKNNYGGVLFESYPSYCKMLINTTEDLSQVSVALAIDSTNVNYFPAVDALTGKKLKFKVYYADGRTGEQVITLTSQISE